MLGAGQTKHRRKKGEGLSRIKKAGEHPSKGVADLRLATPLQKRKRKTPSLHRKTDRKPTREGGVPPPDEKRDPYRESGK